MSTPAEKKRLRDRRAQQALRDRKLRHTTNLEQKLAYCEQYHSSLGVERLLEEIRTLRKQNEALVARQERIKSFVQSWADDDMVNVHQHQAGLSPRRQILNNVPPAVTNSSGMNVNSGPPFSSASTQVLTLENPPIPFSMDPLPTEMCFAWSLLPLNDDNLSDPRRISCFWFAFPEQIALSPDSLASPLDILYGTKSNPLADMIHTALRGRLYFREQEFLALGWILYHFTKWLNSPSPTTYAKLPDFLRPAWCQVQTPHPVVLDMITWPKLRSHLLEQWSVYQARQDELFEKLACSVRVRWPRGKNILARNERNELVVRRSFYETFMSEGGWGLAPDFARSFPELFAGLDARVLVHDEV